MGFGSLSIYSSGGGSDGGGGSGGASFFAASSNSIGLSLSAGFTLTATLNIGATGIVAGIAGVTNAIVGGSTPGLVSYFPSGLVGEVTSSVLQFSGGSYVLVGSSLGIRVNQSSGSTAGYLSAADWTAFNSKLGASTIIQTVFPLFGGTYLPSNGGITLTIPAANGTTGGYLTASDWTTFNAKVSTTRVIGTTFPLLGGGDLSADRVLSMPVANGTTGGYLSATDWNTFNSKQTAVSVGPFSYTSFAQGLTLNGATLQLGVADITNPGAVGTTAQSFVGIKTFTSQSLFAAGTTSLPGIAFSGSSNTGFYSPTFSIIGIVTNGSEAIRVNEQQYMVVGATTPQARFNVAGGVTGATYTDSAGSFRHNQALFDTTTTDTTITNPTTLTISQQCNYPSNVSNSPTSIYLDTYIPTGSTALMTSVTAYGMFSRGTYKGAGVIGTLYGGNFNSISNGTSGGFVGTMIGVGGQVTATSGATNMYAMQAAAVNSSTYIINVFRGLNVQVSSQSSAGSTVTLAAGVDILLNQSGSANSAMGSLYGVRVQDLATNSGVITNTYGVYTGDLSIGTQTNAPYSFYASDANSYNFFNGKTGHGATTPTAVVQLAYGFSSTSWGTTGVALSVLGASYTDTSNGGTLTMQAINSFGTPTVSGSTTINLVDSTNVYIAGAPVAGTNVTQGNAWGLYNASAAFLGGFNVVTSKANGVFLTSNSNESIYGINSFSSPPTSAGRVIAVECIYTGSSNTAIGFQGLQSSAASATNCIANLTLTNGGGGLRNRYSVVHAGSGVVSQASAVSGIVSNNATTNTANITNAAAFHAETPSINSTSTWTSHYSFWARGGAVTGTLTNRYGLYIDDLVGGVSRYGIYQVGSSETNYFNGWVGMGTATPTTNLDINGTQRWRGSNTSLRAGQLESANNFLIAANIDGNNNQDGASYASWGIRINPGDDLFDIGRKAAGAAGALGSLVRVTSAGFVGIGTASPSYILDVIGGNISASTVGNGYRVKEGSNAKMGTAALSSGAVTVANTSVTASSRIMLTPQDGSANVGSVWISARTAGASFIISSSNVLDARTVAYLIFEPS